jgi:hypothetical protein
VNEREQIEQLRKFADCDVPVTAKEAYDSMASYVGRDHEGACIKQVLEPMVDFHVDTAAKSADTIERLLAYYEAIDNEAITTFTLNNKLSPREQLHSIIDWHIQIATDPTVNGGKVLVDKARIEKLEAVLSAIGDGPPFTGAVGTTYVAGQEVETEAEWVDYDKCVTWWTGIEEAIAEAEK